MKQNKHCLSVILVIVFLFLFVPSISARTGEDYAEQIKTIERYVQVNMEALKVPGLAIAFYKDDFTWSKGFGYADLENKVPVTPQTLFRMASVTKPMTATGIMNLAQDGKLNLDDEVQKYVPYFPKKKWPVTIRQLLGHLSGISHYRNYDVELHIKTHHDTRRAIDIFKDWDLEAEPGTKFIYTSYGYNLLGAVIEGASGQTYAEYMTDHIWKPLGMIHTRMDIADDIIPNRTRSYRILDGTVKNCEFIDISSRFGGGGTLSTVIDLLNFSRGLDKGTLLSLETQDKMYRPMTTKDKRLSEYGMGWSNDFLSGFWNVAHGGGQAGTSTYILRFPDENFAVAVASNLQGHNTAIYATVVQQLILDAFHIRVETPSEEEFRKFHLVWHIGLGWLSRYNKSFTANADELAESFKYFNSLDVRDKEARKKLTEGLYESTGSPLFKIGTYMAQRLAEKYGKEKLDYYRRKGAIPFFAAYIDLYKKGSSIPVSCRFTKKFEKLTARWNKSWQKTWTPETKAFFQVPLPQIDTVKERMKEIFKGRTAYPRLNIIPYAGTLKRLGNVEQGMDLLKLGTGLYPKNTALYYALGREYLEKGDNLTALEVFRKAFPFEKKKAAGARYISWAKELIRVTKTPVTVPVDTLKQYVGDYGPRHITLREGNLYYKRDGRKEYRLIVLSTDTFTPDGLTWFRIRFDRDKDGKVSKIIGLYIYGNQDESPRDRK
jgi:CubicO group peptidase (beta-lactamase class C family)